MKEMSEAHFAILRRHMADVIGIHTDLLSDELGRAALDENVMAVGREGPRHEVVPAPLAPLPPQDMPLPSGLDNTISQPLIGALISAVPPPRPEEGGLRIGPR